MGCCQHNNILRNVASDRKVRKGNCSVIADYLKLSKEEMDLNNLKYCNQDETDLLTAICNDGFKASFYANHYLWSLVCDTQYCTIGNERDNICPLYHDENIYHKGYREQTNCNLRAE